MEFTVKKIFLGIYLLFAVANIVALLYLADFMRKYIYYAYYPDRDPRSFSETVQTSDINMAKFDSIIVNLEKKSVKINLAEAKDLFK